MTDFGDQRYVEKIRQALWSGTTLSRASVMVGSGMSLNARPSSPSTPGFPTWQTLANRLIAELYPQEHYPSESNEATRHSWATSGMLRLAEEYRAAYGDDALDDFLLRHIPDRQHEPGDLHRRLLRLPWSDVFTTNYDTLLERAALTVVGRKYDVLATDLEIATASRPRIVKLHGSFPSIRPFIFSEEQFRRYPRERSVFVNLVQQSMAENVFCLVGFSGDDPNFLQWTGWVRDNLGSSAPQIYLCGLFEELGDAKRKLLQDRNVVPIDFSPLFPKSSDGRHPRALEWFLRNLENGRPTPASEWPNRRHIKRETEVSGLPTIPGPSSVGGAELVIRRHGVLNKDSISQIVDHWRSERESHPGWIVTPRESRDHVWRLLNLHAHEFLATLDDLSLIDQLRALREWNWRMEISLVPLPPELAERIAATIERVQPFLNEFKDFTSEFAPGRNDGAQAWSAARESLVELELALLRYYRENRDAYRRESCKARLSSLVASRASWKNRVQYEECLSAVFRMDHGALRDLLNAWDVGDEDPFWLIRQAALLVEVGEVERANRVARSALELIRLRMTPGVDDLSLLSREAWAMNLVWSIEMSRDLTGFNDFEFSARWDELAFHRCNPRDEREMLEAQLKRPIPSFERYELESASFDPGTVTHTVRGKPGVLASNLPAFQWIRLVEEAAIPPRCINTTFGESLLFRAVEWLLPVSPDLALGILLRRPQVQELEKHLTRNYVGSLEAKTVDDLVSVIAGAIANAQAVLQAPEHLASAATKDVAAGQMVAAIEFLSRLAPRLSDQRIEEWLARAEEFFRSRIFHSRFSLFNTLPRLFQRLLDSASTAVLKRRAITLFDLPIAGADGFRLPVSDDWFDPVHTLPDDRPFFESTCDQIQWSGVIARLLSVAKDASPSARRIAVYRLARLRDDGALSDEQDRGFARAVSASAPDEPLPKHTGLRFAYLLQLPGRGVESRRRALKTYCLSQDLANFRKLVAQPDGTEVLQASSGTDPGRFLEDIVSTTAADRDDSGDLRRVIRWSAADADLIVGKLERWWSEEGRDLDPALLDGPHFGILIAKRMGLIFRVLRWTILPQCDASTSLARRVIALVDDMDSKRFPIDHISPFLLKKFPDRREWAIESIDHGMTSQSSHRGHSAIAGLYLWASNRDDCGTPPPHLLIGLGWLIRGFVRPAFDHALRYAGKIVAEAPEVFDQVLTELLLSALDRLWDETRYRSWGDRGDSTLALDKLPTYRRNAASLAVELSRTSQRDDPRVRKWVEGIALDPLPEVRRCLDRLI